MLVDRGSLLRKISDRQLMSESINFNSISNMIYRISSMIYGIGASIDISVRSVLRESRPGFPARGHDSESKRLSAKCAKYEQYKRRARSVLSPRVAWERRPEGPAYLLSNVKPHYLAGLCIFSAHITPIRSLAPCRRIFPSSCGWIFSAVPDF